MDGLEELEITDDVIAFNRNMTEVRMVKDSDILKIKYYNMIDGKKKLVSESSEFRNNNEQEVAEKLIDSYRNPDEYNSTIAYTTAKYIPKEDISSDDDSPPVLQTKKTIPTISGKIDIKKRDHSVNVAFSPSSDDLNIKDAKKTFIKFIYLIH